MATDSIEIALDQRRSLEEALADLRESYQRTPTKTLARMIAQLEDEMADRAAQKERAESKPSQRKNRAR
jgi:hypothetical protein